MSTRPNLRLLVHKLKDDGMIGASGPTLHDGGAQTVTSETPLLVSKNHRTMMILKDELEGERQQSLTWRMRSVAIVEVSLNL